MGSSAGKTKLIFKNIFFGFGTKLILMGMSFVIPRLFIVSFGSELNGLLSTVTQIFSYLALLEAGIGAVTVNALYQPIVQDDREKISQIVGESKAYYGKVTLFYAFGVIAFAALYPLFCKTTIAKETIFLIILLQGGANCLAYYFSAAHTQLLVADGKNYVVGNISFAVSVATSVARIILVSIGCNIITVQLSFALITIVKVPLLRVLCAKKYPWLRPVRTKTYASLRNRKAFVVHEVSSTIFSNTDIFLISTFCSFALASVYSVYNLVFSALSIMINTANSGLGFILGQNYHKDREQFLRIYDCYSALYTMAVFIIMTTAYIMIIPFVRLYTASVTDINYVMKWLPLLFALVNIMSGARAVAARLITVTDHVKQTQNRSIIETAINLCVSVALVNWLEIYGVLIGTIVALTYRMNDIIIYANKVILKRSPWVEYKRVLAYMVIFCLFIWVESCLKIVADNYLQLIIKGGITLLAVSVVFGGMTLLIDKQALGQLKVTRV